MSRKAGQEKLKRHDNDISGKLLVRSGTQNSD